MKGMIMRRAHTAVFKFGSFTFCLALLLTLGSSQPCLAGGAEWTLGDKVAKYRVVTEPNGSSKKQDLTMPGAMPVGQSSFDKRRRHNETVHTLQDLLFHWIFTIPGGDLPKKGKVDLKEEIRNIGGHHMNVQCEGAAAVKCSKSKLQVIAQLKLSQGKKAKRSKVNAGTLSFSYVFDVKKGYLKSAAFDLSLEYEISDGKGKWSKRHAVSKGHLSLIDLEKPNKAARKKGVAGAIVRAVNWLRTDLRGRIAGKNMGHLALNAFALLRSGVPDQDPVLQQCFQTLDGLSPARTYDVSVYIMALEARSVKRIPPSGTRSVPRYQKGKVGKNDLQKIQQLADWLVASRHHGHGHWDYTPIGDSSEKKAAKAPRFDNSVTQFAVLALHAAERSGAKIDSKVWKEIFEHFKARQSPPEGKGRHKVGRAGQSSKSNELRESTRERQEGTEEDGPAQYRGWSYTTGAAYGSMTNAGLSSIAIAADMLQEHNMLTSKMEKEFRRMSRQGLHWQAKHFSVKENPKKGGNNHYFYYMYSFEKACELLGVEEFDGRSWYQEGADHLVALQQGNGSWENHHIQTSLTLLFLNRATLRTTLNILPKRAATGEGGPESRAVALVKDAGGSVSLLNLLRAMLDSDGRERRNLQKWFKEGFGQVQEPDRPVLMPELIELMKSRGMKSWARRQLRAITQDSSLKDPEDFAKWYKNWYQLDSAGSGLAYDRIDLIRATLKDKNRLLRKIAMLAASRLKAVECVKDIAPLLDQHHDKDVARSCLHVLMNRPPKSRADAEEWAENEGEKALKKQQAERVVVLAIRGQSEALKTLLAKPKQAIPKILKYCRHTHLGSKASRLLSKITKVKNRPEKWRAWWDKNKAKVGANGRLKT